MHAARLQLTAIHLAHFDDNHHDLHRKQRLGSSSLLCTVPASDSERTTPTMLSDAEETLADTDKTGAIRASSYPNATSLPITAHNNDQQLEESMDEDSTAFNDVPNTAEEHAYNGACWKVVRNKPCARNAAALEAASPLPTENQIESMAPTNFGHRTLGRGRNALLKVEELSLGQRTYPVYAYMAAAVDSCKSNFFGTGTRYNLTLVGRGTASDWNPDTTSSKDESEIIALVTSEGLRMPRFVRFLGAELRCYPIAPRHQVCKTCLKLGH
ncbi:hypothetical protein MRX96_032054 [Rhipicephalus microplus]